MTQLKTLNKAISKHLHDNMIEQGYEVLYYNKDTGEFVVVKESGCSCYEREDAEIELFPKLEDAEVAFQKLDYEYENP